MFNRKFLSFLLIFISILSSIFAQEDTNQIFHTVAKNGLEIIILENYDTPLVYIELAFKAGGNYQTTENEGLFHLYEHMLFKGNSLYKNSAQINDAMSKLGVSGYNGTTASDYVNYFNYVTAMLQAMAIYLDIADKKVDTATFEPITTEPSSNVTSIFSSLGILAPPDDEFIIGK